MRSTLALLGVSLGVLSTLLVGVLGPLHTSDPRSPRVLSLSRVVRAFRTGGFGQQLSQEWETLKKSGRIKEGTLDVDQVQDCLAAYRAAQLECWPVKEIVARTG